jgi:hypothetical protein
MSINREKWVWQEVYQIVSTFQRPWTPASMLSAVDLGNLSIVQHLCSMECPLDKTAFSAAAGAGRIDIMQTLLKQDCAGGVTACVRAASVNGHVHVLRFLQEEGYPILCADLEGAARNGHVQVVDFLLDLGLSDSIVMASAARGGQIPVIMRLRERNVRWHVNACDSAASAGHLDTLQVGQHSYRSMEHSS